MEKYNIFTIISLIVNPEDLFDPDKGIYVIGNEFIETKNIYIENIIKYKELITFFRLIKRF